MQAGEGGSPDFLGGVELHRYTAANQADDSQNGERRRPQPAEEVFVSAQQRQGQGKQQAPPRAVKDGMDRDGHFFLESSMICFSFSAFFSEIFLVKQTGEGSGCDRSALRKMRFLGVFGDRPRLCRP